ncbi:MAG: tetratricopeptide repeat protein [Planctomycetota bacterium]|jgi:tetratricopeptide (TPR) repeat protein
MGEKPVDIKSIFGEALEKETARERAAYLDKACGNDANLRNKVEALLRAYKQADDVPEAPIIGPEITLDNPGTKIGRYKLLQLIGEGGFGVVYMAEQEKPIRRRVALKIIKLGMDTRQVIARFEAERQALAMMEHPNIAKVLEAGATDTGRPYFVMELVKGIPVTEYCDKNKLDTRQRLELFIEVCKAVQHAHQKGIIHRDIKPTNVLITLRDDDTPVPKIIDFGIAKATQARLTEKTLFTEFKQFIGTPEYMSPEQARMGELDIDTRSDIYSLGVLLYELLTGTTPLEAEELRSAAYDEMLKTIRETEAPKPSTRLNTLGDALSDIAKHRHAQPSELCKIIRGDLDWVVMKTLEKERSRRYETANELARDIERHLRDEPVMAGPPSTVYRLHKFVRRNRAGVMFGLLVAATLVIGLSLATLGLAQASRQRNRAAANFQRAKEAVDEMTRVAQEDLVDVPGSERVRRELLQKAQVFYAGFAEENRHEPASLEQIAVAYRRVGIIHTELGNYSQAHEAFLEAIGLLETLAAEFPDVPQYRAELADCWIRDSSESEMWRPERKELAGPGRKAVLLLEGLVADFPGVPQYLQQLAAAHTELGCSLYDIGELEEAEAHLRESSGILEQLNADFPDVPRDLEVVAFSHHWLGAHLLETGELDEAEQHLRESLSLREQILAEDPHSASKRGLFAHIKAYVADLLIRQGKAEEAEKELREAIAIREKLIEEFPAHVEHRRRLGHDLRVVWGLVRDRGRVQEAEDMLREAVLRWEKLAGDHPDVYHFQSFLGGSLVWLSEMLSGTGRLEEALERSHQAVAVCEKLVADYPDIPECRAELAGAYANLGQVLVSAGEPREAEEAEEAYQEALASYTKAIELDPNRSEHWAWRGDGYSNMRQWDKAFADYSKAIELDPNNALTWHLRANSYASSSLGQWDKAIAGFSQAIWLEPNEPGHWGRRAETYSEMGQWEEAIADLSTAIELEPNNSDHWHWRGETYWRMKRWDAALADLSEAILLNPQRSWHWEIRGRVYLDMQRWDEAIADLSKAIELGSMHAADPDSRGRLAEVYRSLGDVLEKMGRMDEAREAFQKAQEIDEEVVPQETQDSDEQ